VNLQVVETKVHCFDISSMGNDNNTDKAKENFYGKTDGDQHEAGFFEKAVKEAGASPTTAHYVVVNAAFASSFWEGMNSVFGSERKFTRK